MRRLGALAAGLFVAMGACRSATGADTQLDVRISVDHPEVSQTNPAHIAISISNRGPDAVTLTRPGSDACDAAYTVRDAANQDLPLPPRFCVAIVYAPQTLAPGDSVVILDQWGGETSDGAHGVKAAAPGQYRIFARVVAGSRTLTSAPVMVLVD